MPSLAEQDQEIRNVLMAELEDVGLFAHYDRWDDVFTFFTSRYALFESPARSSTSVYKYLGSVGERFGVSYQAAVEFCCKPCSCLT